MNSSEKITEIFAAVFQDLNDERPEEQQLEFDASTPLVGSRSSLDSIEMVTLLVNLETSLSESFGRPIRLSDEKAMSETRSPFKNIATLVAFATKVVETSNDD
ncbi:hypothetical protein RMSM_03459 [Rhodopirellula maiorica SM1]|uniref:Carrier domain-containing protein n=1 Tax=Rhodopirellula maiorica SM1 TaxID=1265738 RepID=M5RJW3_9BACT|nr:hypothetical protein [Rhodopirellula maiorica]EMI19613.1 hypothetical protein RMSM_03459 [Rhodopirellula maiorica SM1]